MLGWQILLLSLCMAGLHASQRPNIVLIVADDLGWDDVSFHGSKQIPTPNIDTLAYDGIILNNYYVQPICSPSRSALMTGRHPIHTGLMHSTIDGSAPYGLSLNETLLPQHLKELGYATHMVGKWHLGFYAWEYTPTYRGFDSHYGYWLGKQDYWDHTDVEGSATDGWGLDFRDNKDLVKDKFGEYSTELYTSRAEKIIQEHDTSKPLFLYLPHQAVHSGNSITPLEAPWKYLKNFDYISDKQRRTFAGMVSALDDSIGNLTKALQARGMLNNTVIAFTTDNGGPAAGFDVNMACNWPLRGTKLMLWEGGVRGAGFMWSPLLQRSGYTSNHMMQIMDWVPTLLAAAGYNMSKLAPSHLDGLDLWNTLSTNQQKSPRTEMLHNYDPYTKYKALRVGNMKVIQGTDFGYSGWYQPGEHRSTAEEGMSGVDLDYVGNDKPMKEENAPAHLFRSDVESVLASIGRKVGKSEPAVVKCGPKPANASTNCQPTKAACLYDISVDPCEYNNIADQNPEMVTKLLARLQEYINTAVPPRNKPRDPAGYPSRHGYAWTPWVKLQGSNTDL